MMGSPPKVGRNNEHPQHTVTISKPFYMGKYEITQAQWKAIIKDAIKPLLVHKVGDNYPIYHMNWEHCQTFVQQMNTRGQGRFRLPTEAEWEYACRAGTNTLFSFGNADECNNDFWNYCSVLDRYMWWRGNDTYGGVASGMKEVGLKMPNPWGLYDMHGNAHEFVYDFYGPYTAAHQTDPQGPSSSNPPNHHVIRSGAYTDNGDTCRSAYRWSRSYAFGSLGFRIVREVN